MESFSLILKAYLFQHLFAMAVATKRWAACKCFYKRNFYVKQLDEHLEYFGDDQFLFQYQNLLKNCDSSKILEEVKTEVARRKSRFEEIENKRKKIVSAYKPEFHSSLPGILDFSRVKPRVICDDVYAFPAFDPSFCDEFMEEIGRLGGAPAH